jgi:coiled-coil-helix-coiled-coil-helix domain-containing protein 2
MPRQQRRSSPPPARSAPRASTPVQQKSSSTPVQQQASAPVPLTPAPQQPSLFANMASTAAGVAVGSAVGHTIGAGLTGLFSGGSSSHQQQADQPQQFQQQQPQQSVCEPDAKAFSACLQKNPNDISSCQFYLDMLKQYVDLSSS